MLVAAGAVLALLSGELARQLPGLAARVQSLGAWGPLVFVGGYTVVSVLLLPSVLLTLAAGAMWGFWEGTLYAFAGAWAGSTCAFFAARYLVRRHVVAYVARHRKLAAIDRAVAQEGARLVTLLRLSPAVPFVFLNYVLGVSRVRFRDYTTGFVGMLPTVAMYVYAGKVVGDLAALATGAAAARGPVYYALLVCGLVASIVATVLVTRAARQAMKLEELTG